MVPLNLNSFEQSALAAACQELASLRRILFVEEKPLDPQDVTRRIKDVIYRFERAEWGKLYDKLHRTGANF